MRHIFKSFKWKHRFGDIFVAIQSRCYWHISNCWFNYMYSYLSLLQLQLKQWMYFISSKKIFLHKILLLCLELFYSFHLSNKVKPCDTFSSLSNGNTALMSYLAASNPGVTGTSLTVGSTICIPTCYYSSYSLNSACTAYTVSIY